MKDAKQRDPTAVVVAYVHEARVSYCWHHSMVELIGWDLAHEARVMRGGYISMRAGTDGLVIARNQAVAQFLEEGKADWLWWVDTDMGFPANTIDVLLEAADPERRPVVGGLCFTQREVASDGHGGWQTEATPTIFDWRIYEDEQGFQVRWVYPTAALVRCGATGSACILIHRSAFEKVMAMHGPAWYDRIPNPTQGGRLIGEDLSFCVRLGAAEVPVHVHTGVRTSHHKDEWVGEPGYVSRRIVASPPATERTAVIVPTIRRPEAARPFMESLRATTGMARAYAVVHEDDDSGEAWLEAGAEVIRSPVEGWSPKCNVGYRQTSEPWLFFTGDDVRFYPGWLDQAQVTAKAQQASVVGTNDLGNPRVMRGEHAVHFLIERRYIDEVGASWDGPGTVCHEGYQVWYADDEVVTAAKQRNVWAMALGSWVEHLHPLWDKGDSTSNPPPDPAVIRLDQVVFLRRRRANRVPAPAQASAANREAEAAPS